MLDNLLYPASVTVRPDGVEITLRDFPITVTAATEKQAFAQAEEELIQLFDFWLEDGQPIPHPSPALENDIFFSLQSSS